MSVRLVDARRPPGDDPRRDAPPRRVLPATASRPRLRPRAARAAAKPFYGTGEENQRARGCRPATGIRVTPPQTAGSMHAMLMSHSLTLPATCASQYRVARRHGTRLTPVRPFWIRASGCSVHLSTSGAAGRPARRTCARPAGACPSSGRIVAAGGHLHGGAKDMWLDAAALRRPATGPHRAAVRDARPPLLPRAADPPRARPDRDRILPLAHGHSPSGAARRSTITGAYDDARPHPRAMSIMHVYIAPEGAAESPLPAAPRRCPRERVRYRRVRTEPPDDHRPAERARLRTVARCELTEPPWPARRAAPTAPPSGSARFRFSPPHVDWRSGDSTGQVELRRRRRSTTSRSPTARAWSAARPSANGRRYSQHVHGPRPLRAVLLPAPAVDARGRRRQDPVQRGCASR